MYFKFFKSQICVKRSGEDRRLLVQGFPYKKNF